MKVIHGGFVPFVYTTTGTASQTIKLDAKAGETG